MSDYSELKTRALAATKGDWERDGNQVCPVENQNAALASCSMRSDAEFIAAANPVAVLELLAERDRLADEVQRITELRRIEWNRSQGLEAELNAIRSSAEGKRLGLSPQAVEVQP